MSNNGEHSYDNVLAKIFEYLEEHASERPSTPVSASSRLIQDLGLDSLQSFEMVSDLEDSFNITIPMDLFQGVETLEDVAHAVLRVIAGERSVGARA
ncbi:MAG TPA: acyl carrier protein [Nannocystis sp.]|jgi:acyl carrier protein